MSLYDLTTLADVKTWLGRSDTNSDTQLSALITRASREICSYLERPLLVPHQVSECQRSASRNHVVLREWPVLSIVSVTLDGAAIPAASSPCGPGYELQSWSGAPPGRPQSLHLAGYACAGRTVEIVYRAGYQVTGEVQSVDAGVVNVAEPFGLWTSDQGVAYANGVALEAVASAPAAGQYALGTTSGEYVFNAADDGQSVSLSYGFVPFDLADAAIELVAERYKYAQRIGEKTHSLGGSETVAFDATRLTPLVVSLLQPYRKVTQR